MPFSALLLSDCVLGFSVLTAFVYGCFGLVVCLGFGLRKGSRAGAIIARTLAGALLFFIITNLAVWALGSLYPRTYPGLVECYVAAIPFFRNSLAGDLLYTGLLFGGLAFGEKRWPGLSQTAPALSGA